MGPAPPPCIACVPTLVPGESNRSYEYAEVLQNSMDCRQVQPTWGAPINSLPLACLLSQAGFSLLQTKNLDPALSFPHTVLKMASFFSHYSVITRLFFSTYHCFIYFYPSQSRQCGVLSALTQF